MELATDPYSLGIMFGTAVAAGIIFLFRYRSKPEEASTSLHGAAIIDSSEVSRLREAIAAMASTHEESCKAEKRQAAALEKIASFLIDREKDQQRAEYERLRRVASEADELRKENEELRRKHQS